MKPRYSVTTFGCQMNVHDSERMREGLSAAGYTEVSDSEECDVIVLNTCSVREKAEQKLRSEVGRYLKQKKTQRDLRIVIAGCVAQQEGENLLKRLPGVDIVVGPDNLGELPRLLEELELGSLPLVRAEFDVHSPQFLSAKPTGKTSPTAFVTVMKGCDERCSFCIVPYTRGPERYRSSHEIVDEIVRLAHAGVKEVTLLGQTVNSYRDPVHALAVAPEADPNDPDESEFAALLYRIEKEVPELLRLRYTSPHPRHLTASLRRAHQDLRILPRHVHLPVQSGSDRILKKMIRRYTRQEFVERAKSLQTAAAMFTISTDIIVGFPGETQDDFEQTLSLVEEMGFVGLFGFKYSPRPYTPALKLSEDVSENVKNDRIYRLFQLSEKLQNQHLNQLVGTRQQVLVEGKDKRGGCWSGRSFQNEIIHIVDADELMLEGKVVEVDVVRSNKHSLEAKIVQRAGYEATPVKAQEHRLSLPMVPFS